MTHPAISAQITCLDRADLDQTAEFYEETMGLSLDLDQGTYRSFTRSRLGL